MAVGGNVNCISKSGTDYMYEDTAGREFLTLEEPDLTSASKAYVEGNLFWHENTLYKVTASIASGGTITVGTNCTATTIEAELEARVKTANIQHTYTSTDRNPISGTGVADALSGFSTTLDGLDDVSLTSPLSQNQALIYNGTDWVNGQGGHTIIPDPAGAQTPTETTVANAIIGAIGEGGTNDDVISAFGVGVWSNTDTIQILTPVNQGDDTVGTWEADDVWETSGVRTGWLQHAALHGILSAADKDDYEISLVFDVASGEAISCLAYRIDDAITSSLGGIAIKFNAPIESVTASVGVVIKHNRTKTFTVTRT